MSFVHNSVAAKGVVTHSLTRAEQDALEKKLTQINVYPDDVELFLFQAKNICTQAFSDTTKNLLRNIENNKVSAIILRNVPIGTLPNTPSDARRPMVKTDAVSEGMLVGIFGFINQEPYAYNNEKGGELIPQICPVPSHATEQSSEGFESTLFWHTENMTDGLEQSATYVALLALRNREQAPTMLSPVDSIIASMNQEDRNLLTKPLFVARPTASFRDSLREWDKPRPLLREGKFPELCVDLADMKPLKESEAVWKTLQNAINAHRIDVTLSPGDLLLWNNRRWVHGRSKFTPVFDGKQRWFQRVTTTDNLEKHGKPVFGKRFF